MNRLFRAFVLVAACSVFASSVFGQEKPPTATTASAVQGALPVAAQPATTASESAGTVAPQAGAPAVQQEIEVGVYILSLGKLDVGSGTFTVDFYLDLKSKTPISDDAAAFEFMKGRASSVEKVEDKGTERFYRILATLSTPIDLHRYPFDSQQMQIIFENKTNTLSKLKYVPLKAESGIDKEIDFTGWKITGWDATATNHEYPVYKDDAGNNEVYSQYKFSVGIARIRINAFLKTFLPVIFLMLIVMSSFILDPDKVTTRLGAISSALVASAMFHVSISGQLPPLGYLTFADMFMGVTYMILLASFLLSLAVYRWQGKPEMQARAMKLHHVTELLVFAGIPILYVALFLLER